MGIDLGAGSLKATIIDTGGHVLGEASQPLTTHVPHPGWSEQDPADWFAALCAAAPQALRAAGIAAEKIAAIGISAGAHIPVLTDAAGAVLRPAILWSDQRAAAEAEALHARAGDTLIRRSLNRVNPTWTLAMLAWLQAHEPHIIARTSRLYLAKDYLRHCLTGTWETDFSDAVGALMADSVSRNWSPEISALIGWDRTTLPPIAAPTAIVGHVTHAAAAATGLSPGTPVICGANDTTAELFGAGAIRPGMATIKLATAAVLSLVTQGPVVHPPISCYPHIIPGLFYTATGTNSCASAHRWLRDLLFAPGGFAEMDLAAATVPPGADGLLFHPYLQGERAPYWDPLLRGDFIGLTITHTRAHFARALYEGIAFSIKDLLDSARALGLHFGTARLLGGGGASATWRQIIADVTGLSIERTEAADASFGAALLAGIGAGIFTSPEHAVAACVRLADHRTPNQENHGRYNELFKIYKTAQAALTPVNHRLHQILQTQP
jgi:xylulokinase